MKTANGVEKPLAEWTLKELQKFCKQRNIPNCIDHCESCPLGMICADPPCVWELKEKPKFTQQEIEDAKTIMRIFEISEGDISRGRTGMVILRNAHTVCGNNVVLGENSFQSIERGRSYTFQEIVGYSDA